MYTSTNPLFCKPKMAFYTTTEYPAYLQMSINTPKKANFCTSNKTCAMQNTNK